MDNKQSIPNAVCIYPDATIIFLENIKYPVYVQLKPSHYTPQRRLVGGEEV
jgi:hypothetical protein